MSPYSSVLITEDLQLSQSYSADNSIRQKNQRSFYISTGPRSTRQTQSMLDALRRNPHSLTTKAVELRLSDPLERRLQKKVRIVNSKPYDCKVKNLRINGNKFTHTMPQRQSLTRFLGRPATDQWLSSRTIVDGRGN